MRTVSLTFTDRCTRWWNRLALLKSKNKQTPWNQEDRQPARVAVAMTQYPRRQFPDMGNGHHLGIFCPLTHTHIFELCLAAIKRASAQTSPLASNRNGIESFRSRRTHKGALDQTKSAISKFIAREHSRKTSLYNERYDCDDILVLIRMPFMATAAGHTWYRRAPGIRLTSFIPGTNKS